MFCRFAAFIIAVNVDILIPFSSDIGVSPSASSWGGAVSRIGFGVMFLSIYELFDTFPTLSTNQVFVCLGPYLGI